MMRFDSIDFITWMITVLTAFIGIKIVGWEFGMALIIAQISSLSWRLE